MNNILGEQLKLLFQTVKVKDIMSETVPTLLVSESLSKAADLFYVHPVFHLPIVDKNNCLVGLLSHKYLYKIEAPRKFIDDEMKTAAGMVLDREGYFWKESLDRYILSRVMKPNPPALKPEDSLKDAVELMARKGLGCIPVVNAKKEVLGIITNQEVFNFIASILK